MSLTRIRLRNFKCFADSGDIPLAPLTVFFGRNNVGKSSILQALAILRQTLDAPEFGPGRLSLNGRLYAAGAYADVVHRHEAERHLTIEFGVERKATHGNLKLEFASGRDQPPRLIVLETSVPGIERTTVRTHQGAGGPYYLWIGDRKVGGARAANFDFWRGLLPALGPHAVRVGQPARVEVQARKLANRLLEIFAEGLEGMRTVGAFRTPPLRRYEFHGRAPTGIDSTGENAVVALIEDAMRRRRRGSHDLVRNVNRWLKSVGGVRMLPLRRISRVARLFEVRLRDIDSGQWANFADVGYGIGQALPVLVEGLRTMPYGTFVVQEPEINLHPDAQMHMADFLIALVGTGRRVIVETHSEPLLLRIRHRIVQAEANARSSALAARDVSLVQIVKEPGGSRAVPLTLDALGQIDKWPKGFMEDVTVERMEMLKDLAKRQQVGSR